MAKKNKDELEELNRYVPAESEETAQLRTMRNNAISQYQNGAQYQSPYSKSVDVALNDYVNQTPFNYDANKDALYATYKDAYSKLGQTAMEDTMARAAALTGGYGNSYAQQAGQAAYNSYMQQAANKIPELESLAYQRWQNENADNLNRYNVLANREEQDYTRWQNDRSLARSDLGLYNDLYSDAYSRDLNANKVAYDRYADQRNYAYQLARDAVADARYADETAYNRGLNERNYQYQANRDAVSDSQYALNLALKSAGGSTEGSTAGSEMDYKTANSIYNEIRGYISDGDTTNVKGALEWYLNNGIITPENAAILLGGLKDEDINSLLSDYRSKKK